MNARTWDVRNVVTRTDRELGRMLAQESCWADPDWRATWAASEAEWTANGAQLLQWLRGDVERPDA